MNLMKLIEYYLNNYFHMIPLWKSPINLLVELPVDFCWYLGTTGGRFWVAVVKSRPSKARPIYNSFW